MKRALNVHLSLLAAVVAVGAVAACGKSAPSSALAPSALASSSSPAAAGATIGGLVRTAGSAPAGGVTVTVADSPIKSVVDPLGHFRLDGAPAGNLQLQFAGAGVNARVGVGQVADHERLEVEIELQGGTGTVVTSEHVTPDDHAEIEGRIGSLDASARTLQVGASSIQVSSAAKIASGSVSLQFKDLQVQQRVHVRGMAQGNVVNADEIEVEDAVHPEPEPEPKPEPGDAGEMEFSGSISSLAGSCPALSVGVAGKNVRTSGATSFLKAACTDLRAGMTIEVKGSAQPDGSVLASRIQADDAEAPDVENEVEFTGGVASVGGACPSLSLSVAGRSVKTSAATEFKDTACGDVKAGVTVEVKGMSSSSTGIVTASRLKIDR